MAEATRQALETPLYTLGIKGYGTGVRLAAVRNPKAKLMVEGHREIWQRLDSEIGPHDRTIWIHAASLGEFEQGRPIIERIKREIPDVKIVLTFFSPSGYEVRKNYDKADCVVYLPFDTPKNVRRFLYKVNPEIAIFVKYEFWRNYLRELNRRAIPSYLISAVFRPDQKFFRKSTAWYGLWLKWFTRIFVQDSRSKELLSTIGVENVDVAGDTRFDRVTDILKTNRQIPALEKFIGKKGNRPLVFMAGSSWPADEDVYVDWVNRHPEIKTVIAPHEFDPQRLETLRKRFSNGAVLLSEFEKDNEAGKDCQTLIIDCFGLLSSAYAYCDFAYIGGGFGAGLHNINEAAVYGVPVLYGPNNEKFIEAGELATLGGGLPVTGPESFASKADRLLYDPKELEQRGKWAAEYIREKTGASDIIFDSIFKNPGK